MSSRVRSNEPQAKCACLAPSKPLTRTWPNKRNHSIWQRRSLFPRISSFEMESLLAEATGFWTKVFLSRLWVRRTAAEISSHQAGAPKQDMTWSNVALVRLLALTSHCRCSGSLAVVEVLAEALADFQRLNEASIYERFSLVLLQKLIEQLSWMKMASDYPCRIKLWKLPMRYCKTVSLAYIRLYVIIGTTLLVDTRVRPASSVAQNLNAL